MRRKLSIGLATVAAICGILLNIIPDAQSPMQRVCAVIATLAVVLIGFLDWRAERANNEHVYDTDTKYLSAILDLIKGERRITIVTTNLDWVKIGSEIEIELSKRAQDFTLILHAKNLISDYFYSKNAKVFYYERLGYDLRGSGFTIVGTPENTCRIAIGTKEDNPDKNKAPLRHLHIFRSKEDPVAKLAIAQYKYLISKGKPHG